MLTEIEFGFTGTWLLLLWALETEEFLKEIQRILIDMKLD